MTCIIALRDKERILFGGDTGISLNALLINGGSKIIRFPHMIAGFAGDRIIQNEMQQFPIFEPPLKDNIYRIWNALQFTAHKYQAHGELLISDNVEMAYLGDMVGFRMIKEEFAVIGNARDIAAGALLALSNYPPKERIERTLQIIEANCNHIKSPFTFETI